MNAHVVAENVVGDDFLDAGIQFVTDTVLNFVEEPFRGPAFLHEEVLEAGAVAAFAQALLIAEDFRDGAHHRRGLIGQHKSIEANAQVRFVGEPAADADRVPNFGSAPRSGQADVVDLRIRAPNRAAGDGDFEFARQIVKVVVPLERVRDCNSKRRSIDDFVVSDASQRAAGDVAHHVAAGAFRREPHGVERFHDLRQRLNGEPVVLDVLADGDVGKVPPVAARNFRKHASLVSPQNAVGDADPHHEVVGRFALAAFAPGHARAVPLRVNAPPAEVRAPFLGDRGAAGAGKGANLVNRVPGILLALQTFGSLRLGFFNCGNVRHTVSVEF